MDDKNQIAVFGGGCFWCTEAVFSQLRGVLSVTPGYTGGRIENPSYEIVCSGSTGHAEVVKVVFNSDIISYKDLLTVFFAVHDPTTLNRQGSDVGTQYRSVIFYADEKQKKDASEFIKELDTDKTRPIVTELKPLKRFYEAEDYHKNYYLKNPKQAYCQMVISPKLDKLKKRFAELLKD